jgi:hypothetical protein
MGFEKKSRPACRAYNNAGQSIPNNSWTNVTFDTEEFDTDNMITPPVGYITVKRLAGYYMITGQVTFESTSTAGTIRAMLIDGAWDWRKPTGAWGLTNLAAASIRHKAVNDKLYLAVYQDSGAAMSLQGGWDKNWLSVIHLSGR